MAVSAHLHGFHRVYAYEEWSLGFGKCDSWALLSFLYGGDLSPFLSAVHDIPTTRHPWAGLGGQGKGECKLNLVFFKTAFRGAALVTGKHAFSLKDNFSLFYFKANVFYSYKTTVFFCNIFNLNHEFFLLIFCSLHILTFH